MSNDKGSKVKRAGAVILSFILLSMLINAVQGAPIAVSFTDTVDEMLVDEDQDGLAEYLRLNVGITVYVPGSYGLYGKINDGSSIASLEPVPLDIGTHILEVDFPGSDLTTIEREGRYSIHLELYSTDASVESINLDLTTEGTYSPSMFEPPEGGAFTTVSIVGDDVVILSREMEIRVNRTLPRLTYSYSGPASIGSRGAIEYREVIAFDDMDGDGMYDPSVDVKRLGADLDDVDWNLMTDFSSGYDIALYGIVPLRVVGTATATSYMRLTFMFHSGALSPEGDSQKFDIEIELIQPLEADHIAIRHTLMDLSGDQTIQEANGYGDDPYGLTLNRDGKVQTIYSWGDLIEVGTVEIERDSSAYTWYDLRDNEADIYFSYPLVNNTLIIFHDPVIGIDPDNRPHPDSDDDFLGDNPIILLGGVLIGALIVGAALYTKLNGRRRRLRGGD